MILDQIKKAFEEGITKNFSTLYHFFDIHETILVPDYNNLEPLKFYPYAKEALLLISNYEGIVCGLYTCSHPDEIERYQEFFREHGIIFKYVNENPEVVNTRLGNFDSKFYFSVLYENKASFNPLTEWEPIYNYFRKLQWEKGRDKTVAIGNKIHEDIQNRINDPNTSSVERSALSMILNSTFGAFNPTKPDNWGIRDMDKNISGGLIDSEILYTGTPPKSWHSNFTDFGDFPNNDLPDEPTNIEEDK